MEVHCSYCDNVVWVDSSDLQPIAPPEGAEVSNDNLKDLVPDGEDLIPSNLTTGSGFPYHFDDVKEAIEDQLPLWETEIETDELGVQTLKLACEKHNASKHLQEIIEEHQTRAHSVSTKELSDFLLTVEIFIKSVAQGNTFGEALIEQATNIRARLSQVPGDDEDELPPPAPKLAPLPS